MRAIGTAALMAITSVPSAWAATLVVANKTDNTVDLIDLDTGKSRATLPTGLAPHEVAVAPDGVLAVVSNYGSRDRPGSSLSVIDVGEARVVRTLRLGTHGRPHGVSWISPREVAVTTEASEHLLVVDVLRGKVVREIQTAQRISHMLAISPNGSRGFVANIGSGTMTAIDLERGKKLRDVPTGAGAEGIAVTPDGREVWVSNRAADTISVIDAATLETVATIPCAGYPIRVTITPNGRYVLVSLARSGEVALFDRRKRQELRRRQLDLKPVPGSDARLFKDRFGKSPVPVGLVVAPDGTVAWVAATQSDAVLAIDPNTLVVRGLLRAGREPDGMAYSVR